MKVVVNNPPISLLTRTVNNRMFGRYVRGFRWERLESGKFLVEIEISPDTRVFSHVYARVGWPDRLRLLWLWLRGKV